MSIVLRSRKTLAQRYRSVLKKYGTLSHLWDFGVVQGPLTYYASYPNVFLSGELKANGTVAMSGSATVATYSTSTGIGSATRVDSTNQSSVVFSVSASATVAVTITNTGSVPIYLRSGGAAGALIRTVGVGTTASTPCGVFASVLAVAAGDVGTATFTITTVKEVYASAAAEFLAQYPNWHLYQDTAGTVPACKITDSVGLCLDQGGGSVVLGAELFTSYGSIVAANSNGTVSNGVSGTTATCTVAGVFGVKPNGLVTTSGKTYQHTVSWSGNTNGRFVGVDIGSTSYNMGTAASGSKTYNSLCVTGGTLAFYLISGQVGDSITISSISVREVIGAHASQATTTKRPILSGRVNLLTATTTLSTQSITTLAASYKLTFTGSGTVTLSGTYSGSLVSGGSLTFTATPGTLTLTVTGSVTLADLRPANSPTNIPAYQRVTSAADYDTVGFPVRAVWDGVDDCLVVPLLDLTLTDKVTVVAGVTKLSDAGYGVICEHSVNVSSNAGTFALFGTYAGAGYFRADSRLTNSSTATSSNAAYMAPSSSVASVVSARSAVSLRLSGAVSVSSAIDQGAGNFSSNPLYIGQRAGTSLPFNGAIQSLAVIGKLLPDGEVQILEAAANAAMGKVY